jgi:RNA polymerase sigma factor (sigma-70 family)
MIRPDSITEFPRLLNRARAGSESAARRLVEMYQCGVLHAVRRSLPKQLRSKYDSTDLTQEVWADFFAHGLEKYPFQSPEALNRFLWQLAERRTTDMVRRRLCHGKGQVAREHVFGSSTVRAEVQGTPQPGPTPSEAAADADEWQHLLHGQNAQHQQILVLLRQGDSYEEVARKVGVNTRTIRRLIYRLARVARL